MSRLRDAAKDEIVRFEKEHNLLERLDRLEREVFDPKPSFHANATPLVNEAKPEAEAPAPVEQKGE